MSESSLARRNEVMIGESIKDVKNAYNISNLRRVIQAVGSPQPANTSFTNASEYLMRVNAKSIPDLIHSTNVRLDVSVSNANATLAACPFTCKRTEFKLPNGKIYYTEYDDTAFLKNCMFVPELQQDKFNLNVSDGYQLGYQQKSGTTRSYRMRLINVPLFGREVSIGDITGDIIIRFVFQPVVAGGGAGVASLDNVYLEFETEMPTGSDVVVHRQRSMYPHRYDYLEAQRIEYTGKTLTADTRSLFDLDDVTDEQVAMLAVAVRADSYSNADNGNMKLRNLGDDSQWDILDSNNQSIWGAGSPVKLSYIKNELMKRQCINPKFVDNTNWVLIPFCHDMNQAVTHGTKDGYMYFGQKLKLAITPPSSAVNEVHTVTLTNAANDGGNYRFEYNGYVTDLLDHDASVGAMKTALEALPSFRDFPGGPLEVTASGTAAATFTLTFSNGLSPSKYGKVQLIRESLNDGNVGEVVTATAVSTYATPGWTTSSGLSVVIYAFCHKSFEKRQGRVKMLSLK